MNDRGLLHFPKLNGAPKGSVDAAIAETIRQKKEQERYLLQHAPCLEAIQNLTTAGKAMKQHLDQMMSVMAALVEQLGGKAEVPTEALEGLSASGKSLKISRNNQDDTILFALTEGGDDAGTNNPTGTANDAPGADAQLRGADSGEQLPRPEGESAPG